MRAHRDLVNQVRGLLKPAGLVLPRTTPKRLAALAVELLERAPGPRPAILPPLAARTSVADELGRLDKAIVRLAAADPACRRLATIPGAGAITAASFASTVDDPGRFARAGRVAAYLGLTPKRWQSGEVDRKGGVSKAGNSMTRHLLYEAANSILARVKRPCPLRARALRLQGRIGGKKARVALARELAVLMHRLWVSGGSFDWQRGAAPA